MSSSSGRLLGVDPGTVRLGLAISDPERRIASPLSTYTRHDPARDAEFFRQLVKEEGIDNIVVGLPVHLDGREGKKAIEARALGKWLAEQTGCRVLFWDERFTTLEAENALLSAGLTRKKRKQRRDRVAAQILLQTYLDAGCPDAPEMADLE